MAQDAGASEDNGGLEEIIVQARKIDERMQDVPVAITAFSGSDLTARGVQKVEDVAAFTPGLSIRQAQSTPSAINITLRGQVQSDILATLDPSVGTYVDGVYWARAYGLNGGFLDASSVQVLKGPQGTLFGRNTTGGALLINSNDPRLDEFSGSASLTYGRFNEFEATGVLNVPVGDKIAVRLAGKRSSRDGYTTNVVPAGVGTATSASMPLQRPAHAGSANGVKMDNRDRWQFRGKVLLQPTDTFSVQFSGEYFDMGEVTPSREMVLATAPFSTTNSTYNISGNGALFAGIMSGGPFPTSPANFGASLGLGLSALGGQVANLAANPRITSSNEIGYSSARTHTYNVTSALDTSWGQIKLIAGIRDIKTFAQIDLDGSTFAIHFTEGNQKLKQQSGELQTTGKAFDGAVDFAVGAFVFHESGFDQSISLAVPLLNPNTSHTYGKIDNDSMGVYSQATWHINDKLAFTGGIRYSADDKGLETRSNNFNRLNGMTSCSVKAGVPAFDAGGEVVGPAACAMKRHDSFTGWSYTAGLDYKITEDIMVYLKTSKGFRSGGQNLRAPSAAAFLPFLPEAAYSHEIGFKSEFFDRKIRLNAAAYQTDVSNIQRSSLIAVPPVPPATVPGTATILSNAGKARFRGVEGELTALVLPGLQLSASGALVDPKYIRFADASGDRSFERFIGIAKKQFALGLDYKGDLSDSIQVGLHVDYAWRSNIATNEYNWVANPANPTGATSLPGITIVNPAATGGAAGATNTQNQAVIDATTARSMGLLGARVSITYNDNYEFAVFGRNLTNERDFVQKLAVLPLGYVAGIRQEPATYGVSASVKF